ncbi:MAG: tRNA (adenosine(37)-N6)-threonylcarbamoyltransferase complex ATPase subunit type 1 TsaE [Candidatus Kerfeldbacteria bacterium]|nr:tRNA (adenosine(37)-N6)-threonylcarbamoyltransferase complex ATPase subunit type 1 TsaE [Candidatus Kerfeldbacteria bacterium]
MPTTKKKKKNIGVYQNPRGSSIWCPTPTATARLGGRLARTRQNYVWLLTGPVGAGKTTLIRGALRALGVRSRITSPTFGLKKEYRVRDGRWRRIVHIDAYRINHPREVAALEINETKRDPRCLLLIEWPGRMVGQRWPRALQIKITTAGLGRRVIISG